LRDQIEVYQLTGQNVDMVYIVNSETHDFVHFSIVTVNYLCQQ